MLMRERSDSTAEPGLTTENLRCYMPTDISAACEDFGTVGVREICGYEALARLVRIGQNGEPDPDNTTYILRAYAGTPELSCSMLNYPRRFIKRCNAAATVAVVRSEVLELIEDWSELPRDQAARVLESGSGITAYYATPGGELCVNGFRLWYEAEERRVLIQADAANTFEVTYSSGEMPADFLN